MIERIGRLNVFFAFVLLFVSCYAQGQNPATLSDYWSEQAKWQLVQKRNFNDPNWTFQSSTVTVVGGDWYLFSRKISTNVSCPGGAQLGMMARKSSDKGVTWSNPVDVLTPAANTAWACAATDGDAFYDAPNNK